MHPLAFLTLKTFKNGIRRAFSSGRRIISMVLVLGYYCWILLRPFFMRSDSQLARRMSFGESSPISMPPMTLVADVVFWLFAGLNLLLMIAPIKDTPKQADVDVLYATPVSPRHVLLYRLLRDYAATLFFPLFIAILGLAPARQFALSNVISGFPEHGAVAFRIAIIAWLLLTAMWVCIHSAIGLWTNRTDARSQFNRRNLLIAYFAITIPLFAVGYFGATSIHSSQDFISFSANPVYHLYFFGASVATVMVTNSMQGNWLPVLAGVAGISAIGALGMAAAFQQIGYLYDQTTIHAETRNRTRDLMRRGDVFGMSAAQAQRGNRKVKGNALSRMTVLGPWAIIWKDLVIQLRASPVLFPIVLVTSIYLLMVYAMKDTGFAGPVTLGICALSTFGITMNSAQIQAQEMLRRVDIHKPMPFSPMMMTLMEILGASILPGVASCLPAFEALIVIPGDWSWAASACIAIPTFTLLVCSSVFLVHLLFPDIEDPTQRGFRALMILLGVALASLPGAAAMLGLSVLHYPIVGALLWSAFNIAITILMSFLGGSLYMNFNAAE